MIRLALDTSDVPAVQAWLEDWAARGWYLKSYGIYLAKFARGEKRENVRYRLQPVGPEAGIPDPDIQEAYQAMGWSYVCSTLMGRGWSSAPRTEFHIWRCGDPDAPELDTDQALREETYRDILRRSWRNIWVSLLLIVLMMGTMLGLVWTRPREYLLDQGASSSFWMMWFYTALCLHMIIRAVRVIRFTRLLRQEAPAPQRAPWGWAQARVWTSWGAYVLIVAGMLGYLSHISDSRPFLPVSQYERSVPYVSLAELGTPAAEAEEAEAVDFHSIWGKSVWWTVEGDYKNPPYCYAEYYSLRFSPMAENLEEQVLWRESFSVDVEEHPEFRVSVPGADSAWYWQDPQEQRQHLVLRRSGQVLYVFYWGEADLLEQAERYMAMLDQFR